MIGYKKEEIELLYIKLGSIRKIAKFLNVPKSSLEYYIKKSGISLNKKVKIKKDDLERLLNELKSPYKVAEYLGVCVQTIYNYIDTYNIDLNKIRSRFPYTKAELVELHHKYGSITKVAASISRSYSTVRHWYKSLDIVVNDSGMTVFKELINAPMNQLHKSILIGSMLGDGGIWLAPHSKNARLYVRHCEKQLGYLKWLHDKLQPFSRPIKQTEKAGKKQIGDYIVNCSNFYSFYTIAHPDITDIYKSYYVDGYKHVDASIIDKIDLTAMAIWYSDDGSIQRNISGDPVSGSIATNSFSYKEQVILAGAIRKFFNGTIKIKKQSGKFKGQEREDFRIGLYGKTYVNDFLDKIKLVLPDSIHYKLS